MRDDFDFHVRAFGQRGDLDGGTRRKIIREISRVNFVHAGEIREVRHKHRALHYIGEGEFLVLEDRFDVFQNAFGLGLDVAGNQVAILRIDRDLAGAEQQVANAHGVIVRTDSGG